MSQSIEAGPSPHQSDEALEPFWVATDLFPAGVLDAFSPQSLPCLVARQQFSFDPVSFSSQLGNASQSPFLHINSPSGRTAFWEWLTPSSKLQLLHPVAVQQLRSLFPPSEPSVDGHGRLDDLSHSLSVIDETTFLQLVHSIFPSFPDYRAFDLFNLLDVFRLGCLCFEQAYLGFLLLTAAISDQSHEFLKTSGFLLFRLLQHRVSFSHIRCCELDSEIAPTPTPRCSSPPSCSSERLLDNDAKHPTAHPAANATATECATISSLLRGHHEFGHKYAADSHLVSTSARYPSSALVSSLARRPQSAFHPISDTSLQTPLHTLLPSSSPSPLPPSSYPSISPLLPRDWSRTSLVSRPFSASRRIPRCEKQAIAFSDLSTLFGLVFPLAEFEVSALLSEAVHEDELSSSPHEVSLSRFESLIDAVGVACLTWPTFSTLSTHAWKIRLSEIADYNILDHLPLLPQHEDNSSSAGSPNVAPTPGSSSAVSPRVPLPALVTVLPLGTGITSVSSSDAPSISSQRSETTVSIGPEGNHRDIPATVIGFLPTNVAAAAAKLRERSRYHMTQEAVGGTFPEVTDEDCAVQAVSCGCGPCGSSHTPASPNLSHRNAPSAPSAVAVANTSCSDSCIVS